MKRVQKWLRLLLGVPAGLAWAVLAFAQSPNPVSSTTTTTTTSSSVGYANWWVWAAGVAVFLIVVIALTTRGGRNSA
jgi:hypothetical protein